MIYLSKRNGKFFISTVAKNHETISSSQTSGITTRKGAIKNIRAQMKAWGTDAIGVAVQDDTNGVSVILRVTATQVIRTERKPGKRYAIGKTKSPGRKASARKR